MNGRPPIKIILSQVMLPAHTNAAGHVHGGTILKLIDEAAYVAATKHARTTVVTASMDSISFRHPVNVGDVLILKAQIVYVGRTSMEVEVRIEVEMLKEDRKVDVGSARLTMVAVDREGRPVSVPGLILKTEEQKRNSREAIKRRKMRLKDK